MTKTIYTIHSAYDHSIVRLANPGTLQQDVQSVASEFSRDSNATLRFYVHNGLGVVAAFMAKNGTGHDILRDDYMPYSESAALKRVEAGLVD
jgi:hypothetical protein